MDKGHPMPPLPGQVSWNAEGSGVRDRASQTSSTYRAPGGEPGIMAAIFLGGNGKWDVSVAAIFDEKQEVSVAAIFVGHNVEKDMSNVVPGMQLPPRTMGLNRMPGMQMAFPMGVVPAGMGPRLHMPSVDPSTLSEDERLKLAQQQAAILIQQEEQAKQCYLLLLEFRLECEASRSSL
eukprot:g44215.t1